MSKIYCIKILFTAITIIFTGCSYNEISPISENTPSNSISENAPPESYLPTISPIPYNNESEDLDIIDALLDSMTLEEKIGQLFIAAFRKDDRGRSLRTLNESTKHQIEKYKLGGVTLFKENIHSISQTTNLINEIQSISQIPMFISVDEEGGRVSRIGNNAAMGTTKIPSAKEIGLVDDVEHVYNIGRILGSELSNLGFNMNFAPVADVNTNPKNPVIGDRSFGSDPEKVGLVVQKITAGMQDQNVSAVLKHFPGHGDTSHDSHKRSVVIEHDIDRLREIELVPFKKGISAGADAIMTAHIIIPKLENSMIPATLSKNILTDLLRDELNFNGLIITDALEMKAISDYWCSAQASVMAFNAGADIILMPDSLGEAFNGIHDAVLKGDITEERLNESVRRILQVKLKRNILK
ncbi:UNVERIFIED_CONTAM: beta-N-acetylhexosaminidase [Acetivibrio alkalicellulosi]